MTFLHLFSTRRKTRQCDAVALRVAARSRAAGWRRLGDEVRSMSLDQARGYIRGRTSGIVQRELEIAMADDPSSFRRNRQKLFARANQLLAEHLIGDLLAAKRPFVARRRAA